MSLFTRSGASGEPTGRWRRASGISCGAVGTTVLRARAAGLDWAQVATLSDDALHARVYGPMTPPTRHRAVPNCAYLHGERRKLVTLELLHLEYLEQHPDRYRYTQFCEFYRRWLQRSTTPASLASARSLLMGASAATPSPTYFSCPALSVGAVAGCSRCSHFGVHDGPI